jgi:hypothetical protein
VTASAPLPPLPSPSASPANPPNPAFTYGKTWRWFAAELQWGLIFGALLGLAASLILTIAFTGWNEATNHLVQRLIPGWLSAPGLGPTGYLISLAMLVAGMIWGVFWRKRFRRNFQRQFRL